MTNLRKLLLSGLTFALTLAMIFQATPAFALGTQTLLPPPNPSQAVLAKITSLTVLESYPPRLKITGTLPALCEQVKISTQVVRASTGAQSVFVWVSNVVPQGLLCVQSLRNFTTTLTIDPAKLGLAPGRVVVLLNPVNGQSQFKISFTVPTPTVETTPASIARIRSVKGYPPKFVVTGMLPSNCYTLRVSAPQVIGRVISVFVRGIKPVGLVCPRILKPFSAVITVDPAALKLMPGAYTVLFNPIHGVSRFKGEVFFGFD